MEKPQQFTLTQLSPEQQARIVALLVQMILRQLNQLVEGKPDDAAHH